MENNGGELLEEKKEGRKIAINFEDFTFKYESQSEPTLHNINLKIYEKVLLFLVEKKVILVYNIKIISKNV